MNCVIHTPEHLNVQNTWSWLNQPFANKPQKKLLAAPMGTPAEKNCIGAIIRIGREIQCLPYAGFFSLNTAEIFGEKKNILLI